MNSTAVPVFRLTPLNRLMVAKAMRGFGDGFVSLLLPVYLLNLGLSAFQVGLIATTTLLGSGVLTLLIGLHASRFDHRPLLLAASALMALTGLGFASLDSFWPLMLVALVGTLNPSGGDVSIFMPVEHAMLAGHAQGPSRTAVFARYSLTGTLFAAFGSLAAALPALAAPVAGITTQTAIQGMFILYALLALVMAGLYRGLPSRPAEQAAEPVSALGPSKKRVYLLATLFSLDAFGGGFVVQSLVALWLYQRFGLSIEVAGSIFFWAGLLTAFSYLAAAHIASRIGLVKTMVYTHLPSSLCLIAIPFCADLTYAVILLLVRSALSQMDVPTRSSYVMAIVTPQERAAAASVTSVPRSLAAAASPALAGYLLGMSAFGWPLIVGGALKIVYDILLLTMFSRVQPPEELPGAEHPAKTG
ncbi:MFS transporter [Polaromonas sp. JS666]|uniref:MFS transporter n=1 Tax=Polaromonas sp. (strain JS666 / ATCC BAA-500) TaxID=296591 RepID=UPI001E5E72D5|nr:MFS transporter [Polaromonas sp. JS666]